MKAAKKLLYNLLCNKLTGWFILFIFKDNIPDIRWKGYVYNLRKANMRQSTIASIFWGFYESTEIRFVEKYFKGNMDVLELGGSCGVVTSHLVSKLDKNKRLISVEANSDLQIIFKENTQRHNNNSVEIILINKAIHYEDDTVTFYISSNTTESSALNKIDTKSNTVQIPAVTVGNIIDIYRLNEYILVCDIEGTEIQVFLNEKSSLKFCKAIIIEFHDTIYNGILYSTEHLRDIVRSKGFVLIENYGHVHYFEQLTNNS